MKLRVKPALAGACVVTVLLVTLMDESDDDSVFKLVSTLPLRHTPIPVPLLNIFRVHLEVLRALQHTFPLHVLLG